MYIIIEFNHVVCGLKYYSSTILFDINAYYIVNLDFIYKPHYLTEYKSINSSSWKTLIMIEEIEGQLKNINDYLLCFLIQRYMIWYIFIIHALLGGWSWYIYCIERKIKI